MKFTLSWLKEYLDTNASTNKISETLTAIGLEVEEITDNSIALEPFIVAEILSAEPHPNADKLQICKVNNGSEILQIVCGAPNARAGIKVVLASVGTVIPTNGMKIKDSKIRDIESNGMLCSGAELGVTEDSAGIIELPEGAEIGKPFAGSLGLDDPLIEIAITPNRGDCLGVYGIARDLAASGLGTLKPYNTRAISGSFISPIAVDIQDTTSGFIGRYVKNVNNTESPEWLKQRLTSIGAKPISALVDITNYLTFSFGRPAHIYDADKLSGNLTVRSSVDGEKIIALDEVEYNLPVGGKVIADSKELVAIAGIIGGLNSGCTEKTQNVFLEIASFDPVEIAKTGRKLLIDSDARYRFERGIDKDFMEKAMEIATLHIIDICGGKASEIVKAGDLEPYNTEIILKKSKISGLLGINIDTQQSLTILESLGFECSVKDESIIAKTPPWRNDISIEEDLIEEIARIYGYDNIPTAPIDSTGRFKVMVDANQKRISDMRHILSSRGMKEAVTFSFLSSKDAILFNKMADNYCLENPISSDLDAMRPSILPNLLNAINKNQARGFGDLSLFEIGPIFSGITPETQQVSAAGIRAGKTAPKNHYNDARDFDIFDTKSDIFSAIALYLPPENLNISRDAPEYYHPGKSAALKLGKNIIGYFGELHPSVLKAMNIKGNVCAFEFFPEKAPKAKNKKSSSKPKLELSNYQSVERDFAFVVDSNIEVENILRTVRKTDKNLITNISLFDIYEGDKIEFGKKSVAISIRLQPKDKTLTDEEIEFVSTNIIENVLKKTGGELRT